MDSTKDTYITLGYYDNAYNSKASALKRVDRDSWQITYQKEKNCYLCKELSEGDFLIMKSIEDFIAIWIHEMMAKQYEPSRIQINLCIKNKYYSECANNHSCAKPIMEIAKKYANLLKVIVSH